MSTSSSPSPGQNRLHRHYESILPRIVRHARCYFRWIKCHHTKEDKVQEVQATCWQWICRLHKARKRWWTFVSRLADFACRAVKSGRKIAGMTVKDVMSEIAQQRHGFYVGKLPDFSTESTNPLVEALTDNTVSEVPDQVAFRVDFPEYRARYDHRRQHIMDDMMLSLRTTDLSRKYGVSEGRISQMRREFLSDWRRGQGDLPTEDSSAI